MKSYEFELDDTELEKINRFVRKPLSKDRVYAFPVILCDNEIDRDGERFSVSSLEKLSELFVGKTGIFDHDPKGSNQTARIYETFIDKQTGRTTSYGEELVCLAAKAYMVRTDKNKPLIDEIDAGIKKEISISCSVAKKICSVCGENIYKKPCSHIKGKSYGGKKCFVSLEEPLDAYEWSFVAVPAQINAGVKKTHEPAEKGSKQAFDSKRLSEFYLLQDNLIKKVKALYELANVKDEQLLSVTDKLSVTELIALEKRLSEGLTRPSRPQLDIGHKDIENYRS